MRKHQGWGPYARLFPQEWFGNYKPGALQAISSLIFTDFIRGHRVMQSTVWWFIMLQGASQTHKCFCGSHYLFESVQQVLIATGVLTPYKAIFLCLRRYYGLSVWFPDVIKHLQLDSLVIKQVAREKYTNFTVNYTVENRVQIAMEFDNGRSRNFEIT